MAEQQNRNGRTATEWWKLGIRLHEMCFKLGYISQPVSLLSKRCPEKWFWISNWNWTETNWKTYCRKCVCTLSTIEGCVGCCCCATVQQYYGNVSLALKVNTTLNAMWWVLSDNSTLLQNKNRLWMTSFNQRIAPSSVLSMATNYGYW